MHYEQLPKGWAICSIEQLFSIVGGGTPSTTISEYWGEGTPWFSSADIDESGNISPRRFVTEHGIANSTTNVVPEGSVVVVTRVGLGKIAILNSQMCFSQDNQALIPKYSEVIYNRYLFHFLFNVMQSLKYSGRGTTILGITKKQLTDVILWLPPLSEQYRIVAAIESAFTAIDEIERNKIDLQTVITTAKSKILSLAIQGKLVSQDPNDEPASVLLERIRSEKESLIKAGKIKRSKNDSAIIRGDDNCYYGGLPEIWTICNLGDLVKVIGGVSYDKKDVNLNGIRILRGGNIQEEKILFFDDDVFLPQQYFDMEKVVQSTDIVIVASTGSKVVIGKAGFLKSQSEQIQIGAFLRIIRPIKEETAKYIQTIFRTDEYRMYIREISKGTNINNIKSKYINDFIIPLPPLAEQHRIVNAIETAFEQIDNIVKAIE